MFIRKVMSFEGSWESFKNNRKYYDEINACLNACSVDNIANTEVKHDRANDGAISPIKLFKCWENSLREHGWFPARWYLNDESDNRKFYTYLGECKEHVSVKMITHRDLVNRWLFSSTPIAYKNSIISMPIAIVLVSDAEELVFSDNRNRIMSASFEKTAAELEALAPLSQSHPFLILGVSFDDGGIDIHEIPSEKGIADKKIIINRSIEFPPEYHSAGLGILNYFGSVLRNKYPEQNAKVKIEQDGFKVRMIIETKDGDKEIIEKALKEYELVVRGEQPPESLTSDALQVIELKTELRIAHTRFEAQKDLLAHKDKELDDLKALFGHALSTRRELPVNVNVSPIINVSPTLNNSSSLHSNVVDISDLVGDLIDSSQDDASIQMRLMDLNEAVHNLEDINEPEQAKSSTAMAKLKQFVEEGVETGSQINSFFRNLCDGVEKLQSLGEKYNSIAQWCGAPQIPDIFVK